MKLKRKFEKADLFRLICIVLLVALFVWITIEYTGLYEEIKGDDLVSSAENLKELLLSYGNISFFVLFFLQVLQVVVSIIPAMFVQFASGLIFGIPLSMLIGVVGAAIGTAITFYLTRWLGRGFVTLFVSEKSLAKFDGLITKKTSVFVIFCFFVLPLPKDLLPFIVGLTGFKASTFFILSAIGRIPGMFVASYLGANFVARDYTLLIISSIFVGVVLLVSFFFRDKLLDVLFRHKKKP